MVEREVERNAFSVVSTCSNKHFSTFHNVVTWCARSISASKSYETCLCKQGIQALYMICIQYQYILRRL